MWVGSGFPYNEAMRQTRILMTAVMALLPALAGAQVSADAPRQDPALLVEQAQALLQERAAAYPGQARISVTPPRQLNQPACSQIETFISGSGVLQPRTSVGIRCLAPRPWTTYLQASVQIVGSYFVTRHSIQRGETLTQADVETREGDLLRNRRLLSDPAQVLGWIATRNIRSGGPVESNALRDPNSIERGQQVRTIARGTGFVVSSDGQALESGSPGAQIQVRTRNGQIVTGRVIDSHTVQVMM